MTTTLVCLPAALPSEWPEGHRARAFLGIAVRGLDAARLRLLFGDAIEPRSFGDGARLFVRSFKPGVTNPMSQSLARVLEVSERDVRVDRVVVLDDARPLPDAARRRLEWLWREPAIEDLRELGLSAWMTECERPAAPRERRDDSWDEGAPESFGLEFEPRELEALAAKAAARGRAWNRAELEVFAQTWSEHCKHKIFGARLRTKDTRRPETDGLFKTHVREPSMEILARRPGRYLSVFHDNAGVLALDDESGEATEWAYCLKMETHNSPSAISPYGGASTGLVGVHRDILGTGIGAMPVANWNVLCFETPEHTQGRPASALPGEVVRLGVLRGIEDGGNQSGIPTVQGSVVFDPSFAVKPLVFAGAVGLLKKSHVDKKPRAGLALYAVGGGTGADGLRGAVMSSRDLRSDDFSGSAVQVASPFVQRGLTDFLIDARDCGLIDVVTDNGAGGFASSVGEMAGLVGGADIDLTDIRLKREGLHAWERLLSESQERMTIATARPEAFERLAREWRVEFDRLGRLTDDGKFRVSCAGKGVVDIELDFLHGGCPRLELESDWNADREQTALRAGEVRLPERAVDPIADLEALLGSPHLCSREGILRRFDHEVQGRTLRKPFAGATQESPQDGARVEIYEAAAASSVVLSHGLAPWRADVEEQVWHAFDEALRGAVLAGARLETAGALDNFCWPDPIVRADSKPVVHRRLWRLVRACEALSQLVRAFEIPLVSGKDSMKNNSADFAALETLVVSLGASGGPREGLPAGFFTRANEPVFWVPPLGLSLRDSAWERTFRARAGAEHGGRTSLFSSMDATMREREGFELAAKLRDRYARLERAVARGLLRCAKDISEGGLLVTLFEMTLGRGYGFHFEDWNERADKWFGEGLGGFVIGIDPHFLDEFLELVPEARRLGVTMNVPELRWTVGRKAALAPLRERYRAASEGGFWG